MKRRAFPQPHHDDALGAGTLTGWYDLHLALAASDLSGAPHFGKHAVQRAVERSETRRHVAVCENAYGDRVCLGLGWTLRTHLNLHADLSTFLLRTHQT